MTMISAKQFSSWLRDRFGEDKKGVCLSREDINHLTGRQSFSLSFVHDIHYELMPHGMAFVTDTNRETFYLVPISQRNWREHLEKQYEKDLFCNVLPLDKSASNN
ncbi:hypothetical protein F9L16_02430 [Agarivorans sp. B2Z047]|uniref:Uncharacterized protein n=1 Tax=Agarivorans albus MKT 106 TaxID=1331007 RepID=R9PIX1_AGAAL|nr:MULTISPECIES: hypothetical protein [Agarivorans]MPW27851.1 hypothetical protein [Agarivorans sp. B2Z047]UQN44313.1 hypothetical protein LQZ07_07530 [Agarivorans sp. B2Z047]GAD01203.1 hypothetical protein AALB_1283 [Agarivorans albus MKT 106]